MVVRLPRPVVLRVGISGPERRATPLPNLPIWPCRFARIGGRKRLGAADSGPQRLAEQPTAQWFAACAMDGCLAV